MPAEPITRETPRPVGRPTQTQTWRDLTFVHWPVDPALVAPLLPAGTSPDQLDGTTYVGLVPFQMYRVGLSTGPATPYVGTFWETNVRLYSVDAHGRRGVVFRSLDASRLLPVVVGRRGFSLPYIWSSMRVRRDDDHIAYDCWRRGGGPTSHVNVRIGAPVENPNLLEEFLTARWGLHVFNRGRTRYIPNEHPPWPLRRAELFELDDQLVAAAGLPSVGGDPVSVLYSPGVPVRFGPSIST
ncbi:YqjF family protein [Fodinicola acaciae]|uniref:YqjF family protein n=1 Tax=Fodinicola acaciae TaxID=2681555 RepID=UPI0013D5441C|nr:DUF2071 domain-containing protein [Fodinicola acaciae]